MVTARVQIVDVAPRDGLQSDAVMFTTEQKLELIRRIEAAGIDRIEVASFVHPGRVPQMADAEAVFAGLSARVPGNGMPSELQRSPRGNDKAASHIGLVLNERGFDRALAANVGEINVVVAVTDEFSQANQAMSTDESIAAASIVMRRAAEHGIPVSVTLSVAFGCPFIGEVSVDRVLGVVHRIATKGPSEIALADTIGCAVPVAVRGLISAVSDCIDPAIHLRAHFHNTRNSGLANALAAVESGVRVIDASLGGIGGCPFAPRATGNIPTEDLVYLLHRSGYETGVSLERLLAASGWLESELGHPVPSLVAKAGPFPM